MLGNPIRYTGRFYDETTGLYDNRLRNYHPVLGCALNPAPGSASGVFPGFVSEPFWIRAPTFYRLVCHRTLPDTIGHKRTNSRDLWVSTDLLSSRVCFSKSRRENP